MLLRNPKGGENTFTICIEKHLDISGPTQFKPKPMLFKGQLHIR